MAYRHINTNLLVRRLVVTAVVAVSLAVAGGAAGAQAAWYKVTGVGTGTLHVRVAPSGSAQIIDNLANGRAINILCQTRGDNINGSTMWDKIEGYASGYVADYYTTTPAFNAPSPGIETCGVKPPPPPANKEEEIAKRAEGYNGQTVVPSFWASLAHIGPYWSGYCEGFVGLVAYHPYGGFGYPSAYRDYLAHRSVVHGGVPPRGAIVYWNPPESHGFGHIGISLGNGNEISTYGFVGQAAPIQVHGYLYFRSYLGWTTNY